MGLFDNLLKNIPSKDVIIDTTKQDTISSGPKLGILNEKIRQSDVESIIQIESGSHRTKLDLYCPVFPAQIFCRSVLIDKLGDLTKFVLSSLYNGHSVKDISDLTQMNETGIQEELNYLIQGGLVATDKKALTELGLQYGKLLELFDRFSGGISVIFNAFANIFEHVEEDKYFLNVENDYILPSNYLPLLTKNSNYSNSLDIAYEQLETDLPFYREIKKSLYTIVKIDKQKCFYKKITITNFESRYGYKKENEACVKIAIPCERATYKARYSWIDPYREDLPIIEQISNGNLLSNEAKLILRAYKEENETEAIAINVDTITHKFNNRYEVLEKNPPNDTMFTLDRKELIVTLIPEACKGVYLEKISSDELYKIRFFPYSLIEAQQNER